ncbi:NADH:flavin oxidoreductase/NADH oxidase [Aeromicrobium phragmitis]|uniref:NADH:flavin oxidoreductase/NADH oxidase n=1 Tax=Aeromicrobium phragmitis TaxID=2478914 RepID=A0A3L8PSR9_9ACTN|nr:NADH:flavin oxidoreductase/NADH oxidase [Aeromicrobium phragmitis]RLV57633.1 NADH:flavin oxidoreductase/NADH oxidase [Aeromicrobium phragmitis]
MTSALFEPLTVRGVTARNRIWLAPMCQYSCVEQDGVPTDWHLVHLGSHAIGGFGLLITEATAVVPEGRISPEDTGLWNDVQRDAWRRIVDFVHDQGAPIGIQLAHAGRKASTYAPFSEAGDGSVPASEGGWQTVAPSALAFPGYDAPRALTTQEVAALPAAFADAARRADEAGFDLIEIHAAHGYLLHQFLSPLSNQRSDEYGGDYDGRTRLVRDVVDALRAVWPEDKPLAIRFSGTDWLEGGWTIEETAKLTAELTEQGVDVVDVSSGAILPAQIPVGPGYQVPLAREVRSGSGMLTGAVGLITEPEQAERIVADGDADLVLLARAALREPGWPLRAAHELGIARKDAPYAPQYQRGAWR